LLVTPFRINDTKNIAETKWPSLYLDPFLAGSVRQGSGQEEEIQESSKEILAKTGFA
jgi:hypothetical protein